MAASDSLVGAALAPSPYEEQRVLAENMKQVIENQAHLIGTRYKQLQQARALASNWLEITRHHQTAREATVQWLADTQ